MNGKFGNGVSVRSRRDDVFDVRTPDTGMSIVEALEIVLGAARMLDSAFPGELDFEWTADHTEACNVTDSIIYRLLGNGE